jgi:hypothetical protein
VIGEGVVVDAVIDLGVWVARPFGAKLPYCPVFAMLRVEKFDEGIERVAIGPLGVRAAGARCGDY